MPLAWTVHFFFFTKGWSGRDSDQKELTIKSEIIFGSMHNVFTFALQIKTNTMKTRTSRSKESIYSAQKGHSFVTPENRSYVFNYAKTGRKYTIVLNYKGHNIQLTETDFNTIPTDTILQSMETEFSKL